MTFMITDAKAACSGATCCTVSSGVTTAPTFAEGSCDTEPASYGITIYEKYLCTSIPTVPADGTAYDLDVGTKCFRTEDWRIFEQFRSDNSLDDIWGDFNILFSSSFYGFKLIDLPVRYYERLTGETKMKKRFFYFLNMLKLCLKALVVFKLKLK